MNKMYSATKNKGEVITWNAFLVPRHVVYAEPGDGQLWVVVHDGDSIAHPWMPGISEKLAPLDSIVAEKFGPVVPWAYCPDPDAWFSVDAGGVVRWADTPGGTAGLVDFDDDDIDRDTAHDLQRFLREEFPENFKG